MSGLSEEINEQEIDDCSMDENSNKINEKNQLKNFKIKSKPLSNLDCNSIIDKENLRPFELPAIAESLQPTCKLVLKDLRIPLSWKWNDHVKAVKNAGVTCI